MIGNDHVRFGPGAAGKGPAPAGRHLASGLPEPRANLWPAAGPLRPGPLPRAGARELKSRQPGDRHARALAATLTMTTMAPFAPRAATP
jgi:hypothetical protein